MRYLVPIDRSSVVRNPRAGQTVSIYCLGRGKVTEKLTVFDTKESKWVEETRIGWEIENKRLKDGTLIARAECQAPSDGQTILNLQFSHNTQELHHDPIPAFDFRYENVVVVCECCEAQFKVNELLSDSAYCGDEGESYSDTICPKCQGWNCCELEVERLSNQELEEIVSDQDQSAGCRTVGEANP